MNSFDLYSAVNGIDKDLIEEAGAVCSRKKKNYAWQAVAAAFAVLIAISAFYHFQKTPETKPNPLNSSTFENTVKENTVKIVPFNYSFSEATKGEYDDYGEDGLPYVTVTIDNLIGYHQVSPSDYELFGFPKELSEKDFGEYIGEIVEITDENKELEKTLPLTTREPTLHKAKVYYYAPVNCKAVIIATNGKNCSLFVANGHGYKTDSYIQKMFEIFGTSDPSEITKISYSIWDNTFDENNNAIHKTGEITSGDDIKKIYDVFTSTDTRESDEKFKVPYSITFYIHLSNGLVMFDEWGITYYPYKSTGDIQYRGVITPKQNETLKSLFDLE